MLLGRHVAEHRRAVPTDHGGAYARGDVIVTRRNVGGERPQGVERRLVAVLEFLVEVLLDQLHGDMAGPFDDDLHIVLPSDLGELAQGFELAKLRLVVGIGNTARAQSIA